MEIKPYKIPHPFKKLSKSLIDALVKDIQEGSTHRYAAEANGITKRIFDLWRLQGAVDIEHDKDDSLPAQLVLSLAKVKQIEVKKCRQLILASESGHGGAQWTLDRAYWQEFGSNAPLKHLNDQLAEYGLEQYGASLNDETDSKEA